MQCNAMNSMLKIEEKKRGIIKSSAAIFANCFSNGTTFFEIKTGFFFAIFQKNSSQCALLGAFWP